MRENAARAHWVIGLGLTGPGEVPEICALTRPHQRGATVRFFATVKSTATASPASLADEPEARLFPELHNGENCVRRHWRRF